MPVVPPAIEPRDYLPQVRAIARQFRGLGLDEEDLIQAGFVGLARAALAFEEGGAAKLSTYARHAIRGAIADAVREGGRPLRLPKNVLSLARRGRTGGRFDAALRAADARFVREADIGLPAGLDGLPGSEPCPQLAASAARMVDDLPADQAAAVRAAFGLDGPTGSGPPAAGLLDAALASLRRRIDDLDAPHPMAPPDPVESPAVNGNAPRLNGHAPPPTPQAPTAAPKKRTPRACPACGYEYGASGPQCYNKSCDRYRFKKRPDTASRPAVPRTDPLSTTLAELEAARAVVTLLAGLPPSSRARVAAWVHVALGGWG